MSRIYLPNASQFDLMNENLAKIANALGSDIDISTWAGIQKAVRVGVAPDLIPVGTQLLVSHSVYGDMLYDVVAHNYFKSAHDANAYTMTLMCHDVLPTIGFDSPEAFYYASQTLPAGTYCFTLANSYKSWAAGTYQFSATDGLPVGGLFAIGNLADSLLTSTVVTRRESCTAPVSGAYPITVGTGGTHLGTFGVELNTPERVVYGSNNYKESAIRQFLNSSAEAGGVWTPQTKFDFAPNWVTSKAGFLNGFDSELLAVIGEVVVPCSANNTYESPDSTVVKNTKYTVTDKFYLASQTEIFGTTSGIVVDDSVMFPYYEGAMNADRIKYKDGLATSWWLRSAHTQSSSVVRFVRTDGSLYNDESTGILGIVPVCTIV